MCNSQIRIKKQTKKKSNSFKSSWTALYSNPDFSSYFMNHGNDYQRLKEKTIKISNSIMSSWAFFNLRGNISVQGNLKWNLKHDGILSFIIYFLDWSSLNFSPTNYLTRKSSWDNLSAL